MKLEILACENDLSAIESVDVSQRIKYSSVHDLFREHAQAFKDKSAIIWLPNGLSSDEPQAVSYADLFSSINQVGNMLRRAGVPVGGTTSLLMPNRPETCFALWGGSAAGVSNPINPLLTPTQIADIMAAVGTRVLITCGPEASYDVYAKALAVRELYPLEAMFVVSREGGLEGTDFDKAMQAEPGTHLLSDRMFDLDDPSVYFHTGGTTGAPKIAQQSHRNQLYTAWNCSFIVGLREDDVILTGLPLFHANAAVITGLGGFRAGATTLLCGEQGYRNKAMMADIWQIAARHGASIFSGVPTIYAGLLDILPDRLDLSRLRKALCGAAPMPVSLFEEFERRTGLQILEGYGMTEGGAISTINPRDGERRIGSIGLRCPYQEVRPAILDEQGNFVRDCAEDEVGNLLLKGPNVFAGYKSERDNKNIWPVPGYFNSGDLGRKDSDGFYWLAGRAKDLIIRGGHNIEPAVIEEGLQSHPAVDLAAAVGMPCPYAGELPIAYVTLHRGVAVTEAELLEHVRANVPERPAIPTKVVIIDAMPVTAVGKIFKPDLRKDAVGRAYAALLEGLPVKISVENDERSAFRVVVAAPAKTDHSSIVSACGRLHFPYSIVEEEAWNSAGYGPWND